jgi:hypothetical protein
LSYRPDEECGSSARRKRAETKPDSTIAIRRIAAARSLAVTERGIAGELEWRARTRALLTVAVTGVVKAA